MKYLFILIITLHVTTYAKEATVEQLFSVQTVQVKKQTTAHTRKNYGFVVQDESRVYVVAPRFSGYIEKLYADKTYMYVKKGSVLAEVYSPEVFKAKEDYLNSYNYTKNRQNKEMLKSAKRKLQLLEVNNAEINNILEKKQASPFTKIIAPKSGYIFKKNITKGSAFKASEVLFEIVNLDEVWVEAKVFEKDIPWLKHANNFTLTFKTTSRTYTTKSSFLYPQLNPKEATLTLRLRVQNRYKELFPGMYASIISNDTPKSYLTLPTTAVMRKNGKFYVFVVGEFEGEYEPLEIQAQPLDANTYIVEGLQEGDEVVNNALFMMDSDAQINGLY